MKRLLMTMLAAGIALLALAGTASAHVITNATVTCAGATFSWTSFPGGPFTANLAFQDQVNGHSVASPYVVAHETGKSGTDTVSAPAADGVTFRKVTITWTVDGGGSFVASAYVKCSSPPPPPVKTVTVTTPGQTTTVTTPGDTTTVTTPGSTTPGETVTVTNTVTVPGPTTTVTTPGPTVTVTTPGPTVFKTRIVRPKPKIIIRYRMPKLVVLCPPGWNGSSAISGGKKGKPTSVFNFSTITTQCHQPPKAAGVTG